MRRDPRGLTQNHKSRNFISLCVWQRDMASVCFVRPILSANVCVCRCCYEYTGSMLWWGIIRNIYPYIYTYVNTVRRYLYDIRSCYLLANIVNIVSWSIQLQYLRFIGLKWSVMYRTHTPVLVRTGPWPLSRCTWTAYRGLYMSSARTSQHV